MKQKVTENIILEIPNFNNVFQVDCDTSDIAIGASMSQEGRTIAYFSENLNDAKKILCL